MSILFTALTLLLCSVHLVSSGSVCTGRRGTHYTCLDWSVGSQRMLIAQSKYKRQTGQDVTFGVGSYGAQWDYNIGKCYKFFTKPYLRPVIAQVTNYGADIHFNQFDIQTGGGGFGVWNACAGNTDRTGSESDPCRSNHFINLPNPPMYAGGKRLWGRRCGGFSYRKSCALLPKWPITLKKIPPRPKEPNLRQSCKRSFDMGVRMNNNIKTIKSGFRVPCPAPLVEITNLKRSDDWSREKMHPGKLTVYMDCCGPASAYPSATNGNNLQFPFNRLRPCKRDGYTRVGFYYG